MTVMSQQSSVLKHNSMFIRHPHSHHVLGGLLLQSPSLVFQVFYGKKFAEQGFKCDSLLMVFLK